MRAVRESAAWKQMADAFHYEGPRDAQLHEDYDIIEPDGMLRSTAEELSTHRMAVKMLTEE